MAHLLLVLSVITTSNAFLQPQIFCVHQKYSISSHRHSRWYASTQDTNAQTDEKVVTDESSTSDETNPEINSLGDWVEARKQWEIDNNPDPMSVGVVGRDEFMNYGLVALISFGGGLVYRKFKAGISQETN